MEARLPQQRYALLPGAKDFEGSDYVRYVDPPISTISDLDNDIHPIFDKSKFSSDFDYEVLEISLRLATRILQSDPAVAYIVTMVDGDVFTLSPGSNSASPSWTPSTLMDVARTNDFLHGGKPFARFPRKEDLHLTGTTRKRARQILDQLAGVIVGYQLQSTASTGEDASCIRGRRVSVGTAKLFPAGVLSTIAMSREKYEVLARLHEGHTEGTPPSKPLLLQRFMTADVLVHEIGHAIVFAGSGLACNWNETPYYVNNPVSENGFDFSDDIWYGVLDPRDNEADAEQSTVILSEWPSGISVAHYRDTDSLISCLHAAMKPNEIRHRVPIKFLEDLCTNAFWNKNVDGKGANALKAPKVGMWVFKRVGKKVVACDVDDLMNDNLLSTRHRLILGRAMGLQSGDPETGRVNVSRVPRELRVKPQMSRGS